MKTHPSEHPQREFWTATQQRKEAGLLNQNNLGTIDGARIRRVSGFSSKCRFGQRFTRSKNMNDLLFAGSARPMNVNRAALNNVKAVRRIAFARCKSRAKDRPGGKGSRPSAMPSERLR
jgi:hypothetical protein